MPLSSPLSDHHPCYTFHKMQISDVSSDYSFSGAAHFPEFKGWKAHCYNVIAKSVVSNLKGFTSRNVHNSL